VAILKICVLGLGEVGLPTAVYIARQGYIVQGFDIDNAAIQRARKRGIDATNDWNAVGDKVEVFIVCVSTGIDGSLKPDMSAVIDASKRISTSKSEKPLVSIESTVSLGICEFLYQKIFRKSVDLIHVPHRYWKEDPIKHGVKQKRVIGAINEQSLTRGLAFYQQLGIPLHPVSSIETAEMSKIVENSYRFLQIAFAEELKMICDECKIDADKLREACNTKWNIEILEARKGVLRHCLPKDIRYLVYLSRHRKLLESAISVDKEYVNYVQNKEKPLV
jgi:nucleotide sugar dehydrogenase